MVKIVRGIVNKKIISLICLCLWLASLGIAHETNTSKALLKGEVSIKPVATVDNPPEQMREGQIQAGIEVAFSVKVKNEGNQASQPGTLQVYYRFPPSLQHLSSASLFETEEVSLPVLQPGEEKMITFDKKQRMPTLYDFVRDDWGKREYQAIARVAGQDQVLHVVALTFSAYYYEIPISTKIAAVPVFNH
ncbi:putative uncharacterized protein [Parachlamydia acanthamoebae UV-7]|uniref:CARDB domain-containing protein n=1 Tax=Parachlamydia acanthamoebae (strain UV7) TaxID=765952 RepID=F8KXC1_PARAV|nr:hypothetical protein pah_c045o073 [Parachlamydia acanthamoebae str. Hall's coccus]CCB85596.1 putative uncharacterized protein [Parachlamydia acanthamoebae UV-7]